MAWYKSGTITVTNGSTTVTGSGTSWITGAGIGEALYAPDGRIYEIANIVSATQITLGSAYLGTTASGQAYQIVPTQSYIRDLAQQAAQLVADYAGIASNAGSGKFGDGTLASPGIRFVADEDTGFFRSASNEVKFVAGGIEQFKFNSSGMSSTTPTVFDVNSSSTALRITQAGAGNALVVEDSTNPDSTPFVVDQTGRVVVGNTSTVAGIGSITSQIQVLGTTQQAVSQHFATYSTSASIEPFITLAHSKSATVGSNGLVASGDALGALVFSGTDGTNFVQSAKISANVDGTPGTNDMPGRLVFSTTAAGASTPTEAIRITSGQNIGILGAPLGNRRIQVSGATAPAISGFSFGLSMQQTIQSDMAGGQYNAFSTTAATAAASFSLGFLNHYQAAQGTFGAGSTVTNQYGFFVSSTLIGATNNFGVRSDIAAGTGRWNFYAGGTAANYFAGTTYIGAPSVASGLAPGGFNVVGSGTFNNAKLIRVTDNTSSPQILFTKARGTAATSPTASLSGDGVGLLAFQGYDGTNAVSAALIEGFVDGTPGTNDMPGRLVFSTTADGASSPTERMRIDSAGNVGIASASTAPDRLTVGGNHVGSGTTARGVSVRGTIQSNVTARYDGFLSIPATPAETFTLSALHHFIVEPGTFGAGSTVTNQYGYVVGSGLTAATNNYGFYSNVAAGTGRWNFYANGTAANYFAGQTLFASPTAITYGSGDQNPSVQINGTAGSRLGVSRFTADATGTSVHLGKSRSGTIGTYAAVQSGDLLGTIFFDGADDATGMHNGAYVQAVVSGAVSTGSIPTDIRLNAAGGKVEIYGSSGLSIARTAVTAPAATDGNVFSGTYTPTLTNQTNVAASTAYECQYMRVGNVVTVSGRVDIDPTATGNTELRLSLPINSNFSAGTNCGGAGASTFSEAGYVNAVGGTNLARLSYVASNTGNNIWAFSFTYRII